MKLWLDDIRPPPLGWDGWDWVKTVDRAKFFLEQGGVTEASLDHDLGDGQPTGYDLCKWMEETGHWPETRPRVHSMNPVGAEAMRWAIHKAFADK